MDDKLLWEESVKFHGHVCGGLTIGYKASLLAMKLLDLKFSEDEDVVCISENDACGVDAIQVILGCSVGKGNLLFHITGKQAYSFYNRKTGESKRLILKDFPRKMSKEESFAFMQSMNPEDLFDVMETRISLPEKARIFNSYHCDCCGEKTAESLLSLENDKKICKDCYIPYNRFSI